MPVAGLPAALETLLSSLLATEEPTSWKVDGERGSVVVVLRFQQRNAERQPLHPGDWRMGWKKKTPAMRRRDRQRAVDYHQKSKQKQTVTFSNAPSRVSSVDTPCDSQAPAEYVNPPSVTSEPLSAVHIDDEGITPGSSEKTCTTEGSTFQDDAHDALALSSDNDAALKAIREFSRDMEERGNALIETVSEMCAEIVPDLRRGVPRVSGCIEACGVSVPNVPTTTRSTSCSGSAVRRYSGEATSGISPVRIRAPPTQQQPARAARKM